MLAVCTGLRQDEPAFMLSLYVFLCYVFMLRVQAHSNQGMR